MGHCIRAFLGYSETICSFAESWLKSPRCLSQGLSMLFLTDELFDDITELANIDNELRMEGFDYLTSAIVLELEERSRRDKLAYFETEYFGGKGSQAAILFENGKQKFPAIFTNDMDIWQPNDERAINIILREFGVYKLTGKDEFDSVGLSYFRSMDVV